MRKIWNRYSSSYWKRASTRILLYSFSIPELDEMEVRTLLMDADSFPGTALASLKNSVG